MARISFRKMHGLGNDFVVLDARETLVSLTPLQVRAIADRHTGVGCDQVIVIEPVGADAGDAAAFMRIFNADGGEVAACGNASRCVARLLMIEQSTWNVALQTAAGRLEAEAVEGGRVRVDMGVPRERWDEIPLAREMDNLHLDLAAGPFSDPVAVNMGNPHAVFFVDDAETAPLEEYGPALEHDPLFPERANIGAAQVTGPDALRLRVFERGVGLTRACGTGACAALVAAVRRGLTGRRAVVQLDGGALRIEWGEDDHVWMSGPATTSYEGSFDLEALA
jgi:diaminopimelate epimerase